MVKGGQGLGYGGRGIQFGDSTAMAVAEGVKDGVEQF